MLWKEAQRIREGTSGNERVKIENGTMVQVKERRAEYFEGLKCRVK